MTGRTTRHGGVTASQHAGTVAVKPRVLVVFKKTTYMDALEKNDQRTLELIRTGHESASKILPTHEAHEATMKDVHRQFTNRGITFKSVPRELMPEELSSGRWDAVATVGGDGTVLEASHYLQSRVPILGINSAVCSSHGHYCLANMSNLGSILDEILSGNRKPISVMRLRLWLDGRQIAEPVLNEVWITHGKKGAVAQYTLYVNRNKSEQKSDGLIIGPPGGTTAVMHSYGGKVLPITARRFLYVVQGRIVQTPEDLLFQSAVLHKNDVVRIVSQTAEGILLIDGRYIQYGFPRGSELIVKPSTSDLLMYADRHMNARKLDLSSAEPARPKRVPVSVQREHRHRWRELTD
jgi:NAD+ kinase